MSSSKKLTDSTNKTDVLTKTSTSIAAKKKIKLIRESESDDSDTSFTNEQQSNSNKKSSSNKKEPSPLISVTGKHVSSAKKESLESLNKNKQKMRHSKSASSISEVSSSSNLIRKSHLPPPQINPYEDQNRSLANELEKTRQLIAYKDAIISDINGENYQLREYSNRLEIEVVNLREIVEQKNMELKRLQSHNANLIGSLSSAALINNPYNGSTNNNTNNEINIDDFNLSLNNNRIDSSETYNRFLALFPKINAEITYKLTELNKLASFLLNQNNNYANASNNNSSRPSLSTSIIRTQRRNSLNNSTNNFIENEISITNTSLTKQVNESMPTNGVSPNTIKIYTQNEKQLREIKESRREATPTGQDEGEDDEETEINEVEEIIIEAEVNNKNANKEEQLLRQQQIAAASADGRLFTILDADEEDNEQKEESGEEEDEEENFEEAREEIVEESQEEEEVEGEEESEEENEEGEYEEEEEDDEENEADQPVQDDSEEDEEEEEDEIDDEKENEETDETHVAQTIDDTVEVDDFAATSPVYDRKSTTSKAPTTHTRRKSVSFSSHDETKPLIDNDDNRADFDQQNTNTTTTTTTSFKKNYFELENRPVRVNHEFDDAKTYSKNKSATSNINETQQPKSILKPFNQADINVNETTDQQQQQQSMPPVARKSTCRADRRRSKVFSMGGDEPLGPGGSLILTSPSNGKVEQKNCADANMVSPNGESNILRPPQQPNASLALPPKAPKSIFKSKQQEQQTTNNNDKNRQSGAKQDVKSYLEDICDEAADSDAKTNRSRSGRKSKSAANTSTGAAKPPKPPKEKETAGSASAASKNTKRTIESVYSPMPLVSNENNNTLKDATNISSNQHDESSNDSFKSVNSNRANDSGHDLKSPPHQNQIISNKKIRLTPAENSNILLFTGEGSARRSKKIVSYKEIPLNVKMRRDKSNQVHIRTLDRKIPASQELLPGAVDDKEN